MRPDLRPGRDSDRLRHLERTLSNLVSCLCCASCHPCWVGFSDTSVSNSHSYPCNYFQYNLVVHQTGFWWYLLWSIMSSLSGMSTHMCGIPSGTVLSQNKQPRWQCWPSPYHSLSRRLSQNVSGLRSTGFGVKDGQISLTEDGNHVILHLSFVWRQPGLRLV